MDREGFRNRLKQYKKAREENPGLKYWEWKDIPKYAGGGEVGTPSVGMADFNTKLVNLLGEMAAKKSLTNTVRRRLYDNLFPYNYGNDVQGTTSRVINSVWKNKREVLPSDEYSHDIMRDDIFAEYLGIPSNRRHNITDIMGNDANDKKHLVIPSEYKPAKQTDSNVEYKTINKIKDQDILKATNFNYDADGFPINPLEFNENRTVHAGGLETYFGNYTVSRGVDPVKGEYRSFYDLWDLNPFYGKYSSNPDNAVEKILNKISGNKDISLGIGKPIEFYDRVYLDDYYGVDSKPDKGQYYGGYIPEVEVTPKKYADGGEVDQRQLILNRANEVSTNYSDAKDFTLDPVNYTIRKLAKTLFGRGGISNCTLSATKWVDPNNQYMSAKNIFNNPDSGYTKISKDYVLPGDLLITKVPGKDSYHTMLVEGFDGDEPILRYSKGGHDTENNLVTGRPLTLYHKLDKQQGGNHTEDHYFRYRLPNEYWLPEIVVTPKK